MRIIELFAGIGSQTQALKNLGIKHEVIGISEIDKYALQSYEAIHGKTHNFGDIKQIDKLPYADLVTYSFPCQDISVAGDQKGINQNTRSGLLYEVERLLGNMEEKPKYLLLENVKNLVGKKFKPDFDKWLERLEQLGYKNYWQVLNAKHYGVPQNRERVFVVSIRKDLEQEYIFPEKQELKIRLKDILEKEVEEKFYLSQDKVDKLVFKTKGLSVEEVGYIPRNDEKQHQSNTIYNPNKLAATLQARDYKDPQKIICEERSDEGIRFFKYNICGTIRTINSGGDKRVLEPKIQQIGMLAINGI